LKDNGHDLLQLMESSMKVGLHFCPLEYIKVVSRELVRSLEGYKVMMPQSNRSDMLSLDTISFMCINHDLSLYTYGSSTGSVATHSDQKEICEKFIIHVKDNCTTVYTDGSVYRGTTGCGACSAILFLPGADAATHKESKAVGKMVTSTECEIEGILLGMDMILDTLDQQRTAVHSEKTVYLFCDSISGIEAVNNPNSSLSSYNITRLNRMCEQFSTSGVKINLLHILGHTGIPGNTTADMHAKDTAYKIFKREIAAPINVSISTAFTVAGDIAKKSWQ